MNQYTLGVDVGGTKIQVGLVTRQNKIKQTKQFKLHKKNKKTALDSILQSIQSFYSPKRIKAIGVGITGHVNWPSGMVIKSPNLPRSWHNVPLKRILAKNFNKPVFVDNDVHCIALAESVVGAGKNYPIVLALALGTGIGSGLVINKRLYRGAQNSIELGHTFIAEKSPPCSCGQYGHFEALVSGPAMKNLYRTATKQIKDPLQIEKKAKQGEKQARQTMAKMSHFLAIGLVNAIHTFNPDVIVLGGGLARARLLIQPAILEARKQLLYSELRKTKIVTSRLGYKAGVIGAALITKTSR